tara:strand:+ start:7661 stop:7837 length:177 start_codon:yes stop_codon:yes gene_type:complete
MSLATLLFVIAVSLKWAGVGTMVSVSWLPMIGYYAGALLVQFGVMYTMVTVFGWDREE